MKICNSRKDGRSESNAGTEQQSTPTLVLPEDTPWHHHSAQATWASSLGTLQGITPNSDGWGNTEEEPTAAHLQPQGWWPGTPKCHLTGVSPPCEHLVWKRRRWALTALKHQHLLWEEGCQWGLHPTERCMSPKPTESVEGCVVVVATFVLN